jgi:hypothetical protein
MGLGLNPADTPDLFKDKSGNELPIETLKGTDKTAYLKIDLKINPMGGQPVDPMTAVFAPDPTTLSGEVDVLLWFHGDKSYWNKDKTVSFSFAGKSIQNYLTLPLCKLREFILQSSKRKFVLVAPTLNDRTGISIDSKNPDKSKRNFNPGALRWKQADAEAYLQQVLNGVKTHMKVNKALTLGNIVLAAHSGGGHLQSQMAEHFSGGFDKVNEVWCFDSSYWGSDPFLAWLKKGHSNPRLWMYSTGGTTGVSASRILGLTPGILGLTTAPPLPKRKPARTPLAKFQAGIDATVAMANAVEEKVMRAVEIAMKTTKIDVLIEQDPNTKLPAATDFSLAMFGGLAGGHYECIGKYLTTLVDTSRNLT